MTVEPWTGPQSLSHWVRRTPDAVAVIEAGHRYTYADLAGMVIKTARHLSGSPLPAGSIAGIACDSRTLHLVLILACECLGLTTTSLLAAELAGGSGLLPRCAVLFTDEPCDWPQASPMTADRIAAIGSLPATRKDLAMLDVQPDLTAGGRIVRTSGTTGQQKFMWNNPVVIDRMVRANRPLLRRLDVPETFLCLYPFSIRVTYTHTMVALRYGRTVVFSTIPDFARDLTSIGNCHTLLLPAQAAELCAMLTPLPQPRPRCGVQISGGAIGPALRQALLETFASRIGNAYSMNETNYIAWVDEQGVGTLLPDAAVRIVGEDGQDQPMGATGRIWGRTSRMVPGYLWDAALTARSFVDGWHITGDLGFQPSPQHLVVVGRADDMLNIGGVKVPPQPIEAAIRAIDGVTEAVLLGIEDGQGVTALHLVVERPDPSRDAELEQRMQPIVHRSGRGYVAHFRDSLPRTQTGKVQRSALKALLRRQAD